MKKSNIKVHLIDEQSGRNGDIVHPETENDNVMRMAGSGSTDSGSGSGNWDSGPGSSLEASIHLSYEKGLVRWEGSGWITAHAYIIRLNSYARKVQLLSANLMVSIHASSTTYKDSDKVVTESGNSLDINTPLYPSNLVSESGDNYVENDVNVPIKLVYTKSIFDSKTGATDQQPVEYNLTISFKYSVSMNDADDVSLTAPSEIEL